MSIVQQTTIASHFQIKPDNMPTMSTATTTLDYNSIKVNLSIGLPCAAARSPFLVPSISGNKYVFILNVPTDYSQPQTLQPLTETPAVR